MPINYTTRYDWNRSYVLPDDVATNFPRRHSIGGYGAHSYARGLPVELCRYTGSAPIALHYLDTDVTDDGQLLVITAIATRPDGATLMLTTHTRVRRVDNRDGDWSIAINGRRHPSESRRFPPSLPFQGRLASRLA